MQISLYYLILPYMSTNQILVTKKISYFYLVLLIKLNKKIKFFINYLRIVYGIQIELCCQDFANWYTTKVVNHFFVYKGYLIQVTDSLFIIKPIIHDFKQIFGSPILVAINWFSLIRIRTYLSDQVHFLYKKVSYYLQTFLLQIDEDGEEILVKIKDNNIFRKQKPGYLPFLKRQINFSEDSSFFSLRFIKKKFSFFLKMIALFFLPYLFYQTNKQSCIQLNTVNLAFALGTINSKYYQGANQDSWRNLINKNVVNEDLNIYNVQSDLKSANIIKRHSFNNIFKIAYLWNISRNLKNLGFIDNKIYDIEVYNEMDSLLSNSTSILNQNLNIPTIKELENLHDDSIFMLIYKYAFSLIKPAYYNNELIEKKYSQGLDKINFFYLLKNKYMILNHISHIKNQNFFLKKFLNLVNNMNFDFFETQGLNYQRIDVFFKKILYTKYFYYKKYFIFFENSLKNNIDNILINSNVLLIDNLFNNELMSLVPRYLKKILDINNAYIRYYLNRFHYNSNIFHTNIGIKYTYLSSYSNRESIDFYEMNDRFYQSILFKKHQDCHDFNIDPFIDFYKKNSHTTFKVNMLNALDEIHHNLIENSLFSKKYKTYEKTVNIVSLYNQIVLNRPDILKDYINSISVFKYLPTIKNIENEIYRIFIDEQIKINSIVDQDFSIQKINNWVLSINSNLSITDNNITSLSSLNTLNLWKSLTDLEKINIPSNSFFKEKKLNLSYSPEDNNANTHLSSYIHSNNINYKLNFLSCIENQAKLVRNYFSWFFTREWWFFFMNSSKRIFLIGLQNVDNYINVLKVDNQTSLNIGFLLNIKIFAEQKIFSILLKNKNIKFNLNDLVSKNQLPIDINLQSFSIWDQICSIGSFKLNLIQYVTSVISFVSYYWFSLLLGGSTFLLWICFEKIKSLKYLSWNKELSLLILKNLEDHKNFILPYSNKRNNFFKEQYNLSLQKWSVWIRFLVSKTIGTLSESIWLKSNFLDLYTDQRNLALQLIIPEKYLSDLTLLTLDDKIITNDNSTNLTQEGVDFLKQANVLFQWDRIKQNITVEKQKFITFSFHKNSTSLLEVYKKHDVKIKKTEYAPIPLQLSNLYSKGTLLVGSQDTGKSFLVKSLASDQNLPIVYFAISKLIDTVEFEDTLLDSDSSLYFIRENLVKLCTISHFITKLPQCVIWIPNIENIRHPYDFISKAKEEFTLIMLRFLLKDITNQINHHQNLIFFASCENISYLDPGFISTKRFDKLINLRIPSNFQRPQIFLNFLKKNNIGLKTNNNWYSEFMNNTMGFTLRDLSYFANQVFLMKLATNFRDLDHQRLRLILYRGMRASQNIPKESIINNNEILAYQIGRAIIQATLVRPNPMVLLQSRYDLWKPRFYYLSKAYLQRDYLESTVTQLNIMTHIFNCLAGCAAKDAYLFFTKDKFNENLFNLNIELQHDLDIAINLFESIFREFSHFEIFNLKNADFSCMPQLRKYFHLMNIEKNHIPKRHFDSTNKFNMFSLDKEISNQIENIYFSISWSMNIERLSLSRNILFDVLKKNDELLSTFATKRYFNITQYSKVFFEKEKPYSGIYHKSWDIMKSLIPKDVDYYFYNLLLKQRVSMMGLPIFSNQLLEYEPQENNLLLIQGRFIWNPIDTSLRNLIFRQRSLFVHEELLSILYVLYQSQQPKPSIQKTTQRKIFWNPDAYLEKAAMKNQIQQNVNHKTVIDNICTFNSLQKIAHANAIFQRPSTEIPNNSEMSFTKRFIASNRFSRFSLIEDIFYQRNQNNRTFHELFIYGVVIESYYNLVQFFIKHRYLLIQIKKMLLDKNILFEEDLEKMIYKNVHTNTLM